MLGLFGVSHLLQKNIAASVQKCKPIIFGRFVVSLPLTGITLPFLSLGGSSLLISFVMLGLLLALSDAGQKKGAA